MAADFFSQPFSCVTVIHRQLDLDQLMVLESGIEFVQHCLSQTFLPEHDYWSQVMTLATQELYLVF